jgi:GTP-binding protein Era
MFKSGYVAVVGSPNAGKSTFLNTVIGRKVSIVSEKVQTTRDMIKGIYNDEETQIVFLDTPGFHSPKNKLNVYMNRQIDLSFHGVDLIVYMIDVEYGIAKKEIDNIAKLKTMPNIKKIAVINKIDMVEQTKVVNTIEKLQAEDMFEEIIAISLKEKFNHMSVIEAIKPYLKEEVKFYDEPEQFSDYSDEFFISEIIREKVLSFTHEEIPHSVGVKVNRFEVEDELLVIEADIYVERDSQKGIIIGRAGSMLKRIGKAARIELKDEYEQPIFLDLHVKVLSKWGQREDRLSEIGYDIE